MSQRPVAATAGQVGRPPRTKPASQDPAIEALQPVFQELGLYGYQARVLLALLQMGSASGVELAALAGIPRSSVYPVLNELSARRLVAQVPGKAALWVSPGEEEVLDLLYAEQEDRLRDLGGKVVQAREMLARLARPARDDESIPYMQVIHSAQQSRLVFEQSLAGTRSELLMFSRPPATSMAEEPSPAVLSTIERGVAVRALYMASDLLAARGGPWPEALDLYHSAGTDARVADELPMKLAIFDREAVMLALSDPVVAEVGFPASQLVRHAGFVSLLVRAFEGLWADSMPYDSWVAANATTPAPKRRTKTVPRRSASPRRAAG